MRRIPDVDKPDDTAPHVRETEPPCAFCGRALPANYALLMDGRGACSGCVESRRLEREVFRWTSRTLEEATGG